MKRIIALTAAIIVVVGCGQAPVGPTAVLVQPPASATPAPSPTPTAFAIAVTGPSSPVSVGARFDVRWTVNDSSPLQRLQTDWAGDAGNQTTTETAPAPASGKMTIQSMVPGTFLLTVTATTASGTVLQAAITVTVVT